MSEELEAAGALASASLAAAAIDGSKETHAETALHGKCANCQAPLSGPFCKMCGQSAHIHHSLLHLAEEVVHGVLHFDAKGWRTLPLLVFFPGRLTRRYIDGQRKTYVSPLALFLFMVFLSFFVASFSTMNVPAPSAPATPAERQALQLKLEKRAASQQEIYAKAQAALDAARKDGTDTAELQEVLDDARAAEASTKRRLAQLSAAATATPPTAAEAEERERADRQKSNAAKTASYLKERCWIRSSSPAIESALMHALDNPDLAIYKLKNTTYKFSFMLIPISLPFLWLMFFWKRGITMYAHAVFVLYSLCFMSLLFVLLMLLNIIGLNAPIPWLASLAPPIHMFLQLRGTYQLGKWGAFWRTIVLLFVALFVSILFVLFVLMMSMG
jgi:uncharacterized membrane protein